jgi:alkaline phosphatase D
MFGRIVVIVSLVLLTVSGSTTGQKENRGYPRVMNGPMVGTVTETSISIWVRMSGPYRCYVVYDTTATFDTAQETVARKGIPTRDYTIVHKLLDLQANKTYYYRIYVEGAPGRYLRVDPPYQAKTAPYHDTERVIRVAFGSCARFQEDGLQPIWRSVIESSPDLFLWLGDTAYGDSEFPQFLAEEYRRQRDVPSLQPLLQSVSQLAIWNDHDYGLSDYDRTHPRRDQALEIFRNYWANPAYGTMRHPGVYFKYSYGSVDFFFLDGRFYRDPNEHPPSKYKTQLGNAQREWLREGLWKSRAPFKVLVSAGGWSRGKGPGGDSWSAFLDERDSLFAYIQDNEIEGVVLLSGDTHTGELNAIPWSHEGGYDFYEFVSSPLTLASEDDSEERDPEVRIRTPYDGGPNFGLLEFGGGVTPTLTFRLLDVNGQEVWTPLVLRAEELKNGQATWRGKIAEGLRGEYARRYSE